ncbi:low molecular weight protein tyrosine phosphatase family protein [Thiothrix lacustris]|uniref:Low molecular weight protein tyrosine phosphatase family protein n=1 Tax=Thiothrix lacustris TaxID=525917 RepID=A0ABY9MS82_9GAMM|nr:low molecular weight protein tyrosine phosphatase family protein [Thiothrix lacustris]WML91511.1 low molecular weight protein tyrosine phosphatase family protein [Thiothrix lacustris]
MIHALFICTQNRLRSPTAEQIFSMWANVETDSAGLGHDADVRLSVEQIEWATIIFVMEKAHRNKLSKQFKTHLNSKRIICLGIPDDYDYMQPELIRLLETKVGAFLQ